MIISKANLQCQLITKHDKIPVLNNVVVEPDGSTVGSNGKALMLVSPVTEKVKKSFPIKSEDDPERLIFGEETAKEVLKNIPRDTKFSGVLEHCDVRADGENDEQVNFSITDGKRTRYLVGKRWDRKYIDYKTMLSRYKASKTSVKIVLNRKRLMTLLEAIDKACPDSSGTSPVYLEFSTDNDVMVRAQNHANGQRALGLMSSYKGVEGSWLEENEWEKSLYRNNEWEKSLYRNNERSANGNNSRDGIDNTADDLGSGTDERGSDEIQWKRAPKKVPPKKSRKIPKKK